MSSFCTAAIPPSISFGADCHPSDWQYCCPVLPSCTERWAFRSSQCWWRVCPILPRSTSALQSLCVVTLLLCAADRSYSQQTRRTSLWPVLAILSTRVCEQPLCRPGDHAILAYLLIVSNHLELILMWDSYWCIRLKLLEAVKQACQPKVHLSYLLRIVSELQGDLSFISSDFICVSGMSSLHNEKTHHYPQKLDKPILPYKKCIKPVYFPGKSLLVIIGTGTGAMQKVER